MLIPSSTGRSPIPVKAVYEMNDLVGGIVQLTITGMRAVMGDMDLDHTLVAARSNQRQAAHHS